MVVGLHDRVSFRREANQNLLMTFGHLKYWTNAVLEEEGKDVNHRVPFTSNPLEPSRGIHLGQRK